MARTTEAKVRLVIDTDSVEVPTANLDQFIVTAGALTDYVSDQDTDSILTSTMLAEIETYLAAHFYALFDLQYQQKKTGDASATFQGETSKKLEATLWGQQAILLDLTGTLSSVNAGNGKVGITWLGTTEGSERDYWVRNT